MREGLIDEKTAVLRCEPAKLDELLHPVFDKKAIANAQVITKGLPASPGAATGPVVFFAEDAEKVLEKTGQRAILVRIETSPEDLKGMLDAAGILTARGGMTSHAAVVARGMGKCCVSGAGELQIDYKARTIQVNGFTVKEGDWISLNGSTGEVYLGQVATKAADLSGDFGQLMDLAGKYSVLKVRANADTPKDAAQAFAFGAEGIGLCRTEHMFFEGDRIKAIREMILADDEAGRRVALAKLLPIQRGDFEGLFKAMNGYPVTVRLLDPRCTSSFPTMRRARKRWPPKWACPSRRSSPRSSRWPSSTPCWDTAAAVWATPTRDHRDAGPRHHRGGHERQGHRHPPFTWRSWCRWWATTRSCATRRTSSTRRPSRCSRSATTRSTTWSAR